MFNSAKLQNLISKDEKARSTSLTKKDISTQLDKHLRKTNLLTLMQ